METVLSCSFLHVEWFFFYLWALRTSRSCTELFCARPLDSLYHIGIDHF